MSRITFIWAMILSIAVTAQDSTPLMEHMNNGNWLDDKEAEEI